MLCDDKGKTFSKLNCFDTADHRKEHNKMFLKCGMSTKEGCFSCNILGILGGCC